MVRRVLSRGAPKPPFATAALRTNNQGLPCGQCGLQAPALKCFVGLFIHLTGMENCTVLFIHEPVPQFTADRVFDSVVFLISKLPQQQCVAGDIVEQFLHIQGREGSAGGTCFATDIRTTRVAAFAGGRCQRKRTEGQADKTSSDQRCAGDFSTQGPGLCFHCNSCRYCL